MVLLVLPAFDDTDSLDSLPHSVGYSPGFMVSTLGDCLLFPWEIGVKAQEKRCRVYVGFIDLEKPYDMVNRETLWQVL